MSWNDFHTIYNHFTRTITLFGYGALVTMLTAELALLSLMLARKALEKLGGYALMEKVGRFITMLYFVPVVFGVLRVYHLGIARGFTTGTERLRGDDAFMSTGWMWLVAMFFLFVWVLVAAWRLGLMAHQRKVEQTWLSKNTTAPLAWQEMLDRMKKEMKIRRRVELRQKYGLGTAMTCGIVRPKVIIPIRRYEERDLEVIFAHELEHIRRNDVLFRSILNAAECIFWFCPLIRKLHPMITEWSETCCDIRAGVRVGGARIYFGVLLKLHPKAKSEASSRIVCMAVDEEVEERIERMKKYQKAQKKKNRMVMLTVLCVVMTMFGSMTAMAAGEGVAELSNVVYQVMESEDVQGLSGVTANDGVEYVEQVTPATEDRVVIMSPVQEFYSTYKNIGWIVTANHIVQTPYFTAYNGGTIRVMMDFTPTNQTVYVGIYCPSGIKRYVIVTEDVFHEFTLDESGPYSVFVENISMTTDVEVVGSYRY